MWNAIGSTVLVVGTQWVNKLLNKQPQNVSAYFSGNGEYASNVAAQKGRFNDTFGKYASQLPEGSPEANEYLQICKSALDWMGQRNAPITPMATMESEGQRLVDSYQSKSVIGKAADVINAAVDPNTLTKITDPIQQFFSLFSLKKDEPETAYLGAPKTDTVIPILITQEPQAAPQVTIEQKETEKETGFEKFAIPVGIAVVSGILLFYFRR